MFMRIVFIYKVVVCKQIPTLCQALDTRCVKYNLRNASEFSILRFNKSSSSKSFKHWAPRLYRALPEELKSVVSLSGFKHKLRCWLDQTSIELPLI